MLAVDYGENSRKPRKLIDMPSESPPSIGEYVEAHTSEPDSVFGDIAIDVQSTGSAGMMSGRTVGYFLNTLVAITGAKRVLEIGTFVGYSALMMATALPEDGEVITLDVSADFTNIARKHWARHPAGEKIQLILGPATETLDTLEPGFDVVFIDADKDNYPIYYEKSLNLLSRRGVIVVDNVFQGSRVLQSEVSDDDPRAASVRAVQLLNETVQNDQRVNNVMLTVRDGLTLIRRADAHLA